MEGGVGTWGPGSRVTAASTLCTHSSEHGAQLLTACAALTERLGDSERVRFSEQPGNKTWLNKGLW